MHAIPQPKTAELVERINALKVASPYFIDSSQVCARSHEWRDIKREIDRLRRIDACAAWELTGAWKSLAGDCEGTELASSNSAALGITRSNGANWVVNRLNLGLFRLAQQKFAEVGAPHLGQFTRIVSDGFKAGAIAQAADFIERAEEMGIDWNEADKDDILKAHRLLLAAGISDDHVAQHLDVAGVILRRHRIRPHICPRVTTADGLFHGVTYSLGVPVSAREAFKMNAELAEEEDRAGIARYPAFDVVFEALSS
jgi:hypothetical protein